MMRRERKRKDSDGMQDDELFWLPREYYTACLHEVSLSAYVSGTAARLIDNC